MFLVKAGTTIQIQTPNSDTHFYWSGWMPYTTKEDKLYDKHEVWDAVSVHNSYGQIPFCVLDCVQHHGVWKGGSVSRW